MYAVIDLKQVPAFDDKMQAFMSHADLVTNNPEANWHVMGTVSPSDDNALERLYALCDQLLRVSKINPIHLEMVLENIVGDKVTYTAARIMIDARSKLDETV